MIDCPSWTFSSKKKKKKKKEISFGGLIFTILEKMTLFLEQGCGQLCCRAIKSRNTCIRKSSRPTQNVRRNADSTWQWAWQRRAMQFRGLEMRRMAQQVVAQDGTSSNKCSINGDELGNSVSPWRAGLKRSTGQMWPTDRRLLPKRKQPFDNYSC